MLSIVSLRCRFNWDLCILSGNLKEGASIKESGNATAEREIGAQWAKI